MRYRFCNLADDLDISDIGFGAEQFKPKAGTPPATVFAHKYVRPDLRPDPNSDAEFWIPRGVGYDLSGFVKSKEAGARIVNLSKM